MLYEYFVALMAPDYLDPENPVGIYRSLKNVPEFQMLGRDGSWTYAEAMTDDFRNGRSELVKVSKETLTKIIKRGYAGLPTIDIEKMLMKQEVA